jgi:hypothetical protein
LPLTCFSTSRRALAQDHDIKKMIAVHAPHMQAMACSGATLFHRPQPSLTEADFLSRSSARLTAMGCVAPCQ